MSDAAMKFILLVEVHFPRPKFAGDEAKEAIWLRSMREILAGYDAAVVLEAAETIVRTRDPQSDGTMFPKPAEIIAVLDAVKARQSLRAVPLLESQEARTKREQYEAELRSWTLDRQTLATDLCRTDLGRRAAREGWIGALWAYARRHMRLPEEEREIDALRRDGIADRHAIAQIVSSPAPDAVGASLRDMAGQILARSERIAVTVLDGKEAEAR